jgi:hypothetical protein
MLQVWRLLAARAVAPAEQRAARLGDQVLALGGRWRGNGKHETPEEVGCAGHPKLPGMHGTARGVLWGVLV